MTQDIILPLLSIILGFLYSKWLYKANNGFFRKNVDLFSNSKDLGGWFAVLVLVLITGILFLIIGISKYL
jgi:hypothetical protein